MKRDKWTQQLHDKLAEHETAAPEGLWADIEAALAQQPEAVQPAPAQQPKAAQLAPAQQPKAAQPAPAQQQKAVQPAPAQQPKAAQPAPAQQPKPETAHSRFVTLRRWAVAASVAALLFGGGYLWWKASEQSQQTTQPITTPQEKELLAQSPAPQGEELLAQSHAPQEEDLLAQPFPTPQGEDLLAQSHAPQGEEILAQPFPAPQGEGLGVGSETYSDRSQDILSEEIIQTPPLPPPLEGRGMAAREKPQPHVAEEPQPQTVEEPQRQIAALPRHQPTEQPVAKKNQQLSLGLYAMNGLDNQNSSNGVQMAEALAKQYMDTYSNSYAAARSIEPIWLSGYEERQHHHRPITYGLTLSYPLSDQLSLTTGVVYTKLKSDFTQIMRNQQIQQEQTLHYIGIPLNLSYKLWTYSSFRTYLSAGVKADWNVATHLDTEGVSQELPKDRLQWSLNGSVGLQYDVIPQLGLYAEPSLNWYPDNGSMVQNYFKDKPLSFGLQIGLRLNLK